MPEHFAPLFLAAAAEGCGKMVPPVHLLLEPVAQWQSMAGFNHAPYPAKGQALLKATNDKAE